MPFEFTGKAEVKDLNPRKGTGDDSQAALDIRLVIEGLPLAAAASALGVEDPEQLKRSLFRSVAEDAEESARFYGIKSIASVANWEDKHAVALSGFRRLRVHRVGKISLIPRAAGKFDCNVQITIAEPPAGFTDLLMQQINSTVHMDLQHDAELGLQGGDAASPAPRKPKPRGESLALSRHDRKIGRKDANRALRGNSRPPRAKKDRAA